MLTTDEAIAIGVRKYRDLYPEGTIPAKFEDEAVLGATVGTTTTAVHVTFGIKGRRDPFYLFKAVVDRQTREVTVEIAADWRRPNLNELDST